MDPVTTAIIEALSTAASGATTEVAKKAISGYSSFWCKRWRSRGAQPPMAMLRKYTSRDRSGDLQVIDKADVFDPNRQM